MATNVQRWQAVGDALLNRPATAAQLTKLGDSIAGRCGATSSYANMTNNEKAGFCLTYVLNQCKLWIKDNDTVSAIKTQELASAVIDTDFAVTP